jgi:indole-3-glycerol phosphate synthase
MILDKIVAHKRQELRQRQQAMPLSHLESMTSDLPAPLGFAEVLAQRGVSLIAEVKRASPSKGLLCPEFDPIHLARTYAANGAAAISVLTDEHFFQGKLQYLNDIRWALETSGGNGGTPRSRPPLLRKDFILHPYQVYEARVHGADALLLIVAILSNEMLAELQSLTRQLGMTPLIEVHDESELERAMQLNPDILGINNRNLQDFAVDLATFGRLRALIPDKLVTVAESGVHTAQDVQTLGEMGADAVLVGEARVTAASVGAKVQELAGNGRAERNGEHER